MTFGKKEPIKKTQYETENQEIGRSAYPKIQPTLDRIGDLTMNPDEYRQKMMNTYYDPNKTASWSDLQRAINTNLSNATARNYNTMAGGYSSSGQKYYDQNTRAMNDLAARYYDNALSGANALYQNDLGNTQKYYGTLLGTHDLAKAPDAIDSYNDLVKESNKQWWANALNELGAVGEALAPGPWKAIGTSMRIGGWAGSKDYGDAMARLGGQIGLSSDPNAYRTGVEDLGSITTSGINNWMNWGGIMNPMGNTGNANGKSQGDSWEELIKRNGWEKYLAK
ncbi:MAG: hypothetical protein J6Y02_13225 [Pseudobutyrivibrio sp.]|nr:hypothetical protein [Pseudobutyrivibrio sp.]